MDKILIFVLSFGLVVWYIRPLYNFFAKRKYSLIGVDKQSIFKKIQSSLPAIIFYTLLLGFFLYPAFTNNLINSYESGSLVTLELIVIFVITRVDKNQAKYIVTSKSVSRGKKEIEWDSSFTIEFKHNIFLLLHKPRFILDDGNTKLVIPILSKNINQFIETIKKNREDGYLVEAIYENIKNYYVTNKKLKTHLTKFKK